jgi:hypothetical protein
MARRSRRRNQYGYRFTPRRKLALKKAQAKSAQKRRGSGISGTHIAIGAGVLGTAIAGGVVAHHKIRGNTLGFSTGKNQHLTTGKTPGVLRHANIKGQHQVSLGIGSRRFSVNYDTRGRGTRTMEAHRRVVLGKALAKKRANNPFGNPDVGPDSSNNPSRNFTTARITSVGGSAPSRQIKFGTYPVTGTTTTHVRNPLARAIMGESKRTVMGKRVRSLHG